MYWSLNQLQFEIVKTFVNKKCVLDLGCGDLSLARYLKSKCRASLVHGIDRKIPDNLKGAIFSRISFEEYSENMETYDVSVLSWPWLDPYDTKFIIKIIMNAPILIYLGLNDGFTYCGSSELFCHLTQYKVLNYIEDRFNNLIVYDLTTKVERLPLKEEELGILN
jgi:hypothetical protein